MAGPYPEKGSKKMASGRAMVWHGEIRKEVLRAIGLAELWRAGNTAEVVRAANDGGLSDPFILATDSVHVNLHLSLIRLFDEDPRSLAFKTLFRELGRSDVDDIGEFERARVLFDSANTTRHRREIRNLRNKVLAHTDATSGKKHDARYGDEMELLLEVREIFEAFSAAISMPSGLMTAPAGFAASGRKFWAATLRSP